MVYEEIVSQTGELGSANVISKDAAAYDAAMLLSPMPEADRDT